MQLIEAVLDRIIMINCERDCSRSLVLFCLIGLLVLDKPLRKPKIFCTEELKRNPYRAQYDRAILGDIRCKWYGVGLRAWVIQKVVTSHILLIPLLEYNWYTHTYHHCQALQNTDFEQVIGLEKVLPFVTIRDCNEAALGSCVKAGLNSHNRIFIFIVDKVFISQTIQWKIKLAKRLFGYCFVQS